MQGIGVFMLKTCGTHLTISEIIVYPIMDEVMGDEGKEITEKDRDSHQRIKEVSAPFEA
jgi:hypothetical protein